MEPNGNFTQTSIPVMTGISRHRDTFFERFEYVASLLVLFVCPLRTAGLYLLYFCDIDSPRGQSHRVSLHHL
jgi:hypothetical protein